MWCSREEGVSRNIVSEASWSLSLSFIVILLRIRIPYDQIPAYLHLSHHILLLSGIWWLRGISGSGRRGAPHEGKSSWRQSPRLNPDTTTTSSNYFRFHLPQMLRQSKGRGKVSTSNNCQMCGFSRHFRSEFKKPVIKLNALRGVSEKAESCLSLTPL